MVLGFIPQCIPGSHLLLSAQYSNSTTDWPDHTVWKFYLEFKRWSRPFLQIESHFSGHFKELSSDWVSSSLPSGLNCLHPRLLLQQYHATLLLGLDQNKHNLRSSPRLLWAFPFAWPSGSCFVRTWRKIEVEVIFTLKPYWRKGSHLGLEAMRLFSFRQAHADGWMMSSAPPQSITDLQAAQAICQHPHAGCSGKSPSRGWF